MSAPAPPRANLSELLGLVDVSRARSLTAEQPLLADVATLYGERQLQHSSETGTAPLTDAFLVQVVALIRKAYSAGWAEGMRFASQQFDALGVSTDDLSLPLGSADDQLVKDFLTGQVAVVRDAGSEAVMFTELLRRAQLAVVSAVQMGRSDATEAAFEAVHIPGAQKMWVARFDLNTAPCPQCARLHGEHIPLGGKFDVPDHEPAPYDGELGEPPRHPNCRCSLILYVPEWFDGDASSGPTPLSMKLYAEWALNATVRDREDMVAATIVRVGSYTRMVRGRLQHVDGYFYHVESGTVVSAAQARALGGGEIRTVSVQQARALRTNNRAPVGQAAGRAVARRPVPGHGQLGLDVGHHAPNAPSVSVGQAPRAAPAADAEGAARRRTPREPNKQWAQGEYEIKMPSGQDTKVVIKPDGSSTATSGDRTEKANAKQTKQFLDFWDGQGAVTQKSGHPDPAEKKESEKLGRDVNDPKPDPVRDADLETDWQGDRPAKKAAPPEPDDEAAAKAEGVAQREKAKPDEKKPEEKKPADKASAPEKTAAKAPDKPAEKKSEPEKKPADKAGDSEDPNSDIKKMTPQELASEIAAVEDELRDMRRSGSSVDDGDYRDSKKRLAALNAEEDSRTPDAADQSESPAADRPEAKQADRPAEPEKAAAKKPAEEKPASEKPEPEKAAAKKPTAEKPAAKEPAAKKPAAPKEKAPAVSAEDAARAPAAVPKVDKVDSIVGRKRLQRAKEADKVIQVPGDDGAALASALQLVQSTRHKHHVKVTDDSTKVSLKHIPVSNDGSRQYLVHSNGIVFERGIDADGNESLTQVPHGQVENLIGPKLSGESRPSLDEALGKVRSLTDDQLSDYMDEAIKSDRIDDFEKMANESDRREGNRARTQAQHEARAAEIERLLDQGYGEGEAVEKVTGVSVDKQKRKLMIDGLRSEGYTGVNLDELSKKAYKNYLHDLEISAQDPTAMYYVTKDAEKKGVDPQSMFYGSDEHRSKYISDELRDFFEENGYPKSFDDWQKSYLSQMVDTDQLNKNKSGEKATKTDHQLDVDAIPAAPEQRSVRGFRGRNEDGSERAEEKRPEPTPAPKVTPAPAPKAEPEDPAGYKPTGRWQEADKLTDDEVDLEKQAADKALAEAVTSGMRSSSPQMFDLKLRAKKFGEVQEERRGKNTPVSEPSAPEPSAPKPSAPEPDRPSTPEPDRPAAPAPPSNSLREPYQDKPNAVNVKMASDVQKREARFMFEDALDGNQESDDSLGAYLSPDGSALQVHDKRAALETIDNALEIVDGELRPPGGRRSIYEGEDKQLLLNREKGLKQLRARVDKAPSAPAPKASASSPEDREDLKVAKRAATTGAAPLFMFHGDDELKAMKERNDAALARDDLKPDSAERKHRQNLDGKLQSTIAIRDREAADRAARQVAQESAPPVPEREPSTPIEDVRSQLDEIRMHATSDNGSPEDREDLAVATDWAQGAHGNPDKQGNGGWSEERKESYDRALLAGVAEARAQRELNEKFAAERKARQGAKLVPPPSAVLESPAPLPPEHADIGEMDDHQLSSEWDAVQRDMRDMRADGVKTDDEDYLENKQRVAALFSEMARRAQDGNREYIGGTPSRLQKLEKLSREIFSENDAAKRSALEARLVRLFRGEAE